MKKLSHCQIPYLVKSRQPISGVGFIAICHGYFVFRTRCFEYLIYIDNRRNYFVNIHFNDDRGEFVSLDFRIYSKRGFACCPIGRVSQLISLMYSEYISRTNK